MKASNLSTQPSHKIILDNLASRLYNHYVPRIQDVVHALRQQWEQDEKALHRILDEQNKLRGAHIRFNDLQEQAKHRTERLRRLTALLEGTERNSPKSERFLDRAEKLGIDVDPVKAVLLEVPLWEVITEILRQTPELQIVDLEVLLKGLEYKVSRQAIESALQTHPEVFSMKKRGREKFVSLKGV